MHLVKSDISSLQYKWTHCNRFHVTQIFQSIITSKLELQEPCEAGWFSLYIGKGEKLKNRIDEHLNHPPTHATYGLKLSKREKFLDDHEIEIGFWHLPEMPGVSREIKQFIITNLESRLRDELKPWIGKQ